MKSLSRVRLLVTLWTAAYQAPPVHGIFQARVLEWGAIAFSALDIERGLKLVTDLIFKPVTLKGMRKDTLGRGSIGKSTCSF